MPRNRDVIPRSDDERIRALYEAHGAALRGFLQQLAPNASEDLLQETLVRAWRHRDELVADVDSLRPWLYTVARRVAIDHFRAYRARPKPANHSDIGLIPAPKDDIDRLLTTVAVRRAVRSLSPAHRTILYQLFYRGQTIAETATRLGVPEGTAKSRAHYALQALRASLSSV